MSFKSNWISNIVCVLNEMNILFHSEFIFFLYRSISVFIGFTLRVPCIAFSRVVLFHFLKFYMMFFKDKSYCTNYRQRKNVFTKSFCFTFIPLWDPHLERCTFIPENDIIDIIIFKGSYLQLYGTKTISLFADSK